MVYRSRLRQQDGFIREVAWVVLVIAVGAVVFLDGMALFSTHQAVRKDAATAVDEARAEYAQTLSVPAAQLAARQYLLKTGSEMVRFAHATGPEGEPVLSVSVRTEAHTYAFRFLGVVPGLDDWVRDMTHPVATESSE